mgnify:CR=1 FL=1
MSIALLPSEHMGTKQDQGYVCEGIAEAIRNSLADEHLRRELAGHRGSECHVNPAQRG